MFRYLGDECRKKHHLLIRVGEEAFISRGHPAFSLLVLSTNVGAAAGAGGERFKSRDGGGLFRKWPCFIAEGTGPLAT